MRNLNDEMHSYGLDWWGQSETIDRWKVTFTNGATKNYNSLNSINLI